MKHICRLLCLLLVLVLLTGCNGKTVASVSPAPSEETTAPTTLATEPPTEPPTEAPTERQLTAFDIYFKAKAQHRIRLPATPSVKRCFCGPVQTA